MSVRINIYPGSSGPSGPTGPTAPPGPSGPTAGHATFETVYASASDLVFWTNEDSIPHAPMGMNADPGKSTEAIQPDYTGTVPWAPYPNPYNYDCKLHPNEKGVLYLYNDFTPVTPVTPTPVSVPLPVITGGVPPYTFKSPDLPPYMTLVSATGPIGATVGIDAVFVGSGPTGATISITLNASDSKGNNIDQQVITFNVT